VPERQADGSVVWYGMMLDITERKLAEEAAKRLTADLSATLQAMPDLMLEVDAEGTYLAIHARDRQVLPLSDDQLIGRTVRELFPPETAGQCLAGLKEAAEKGTSLGRLISVDGPGGRRWFEHSIARKNAVEEDEAPRFIVISREITERKRAELEREEHLRFLEAMDRINRAIHGTDDLETVLTSAIGAVLDIFDCDRVFLASPCDPEATAWTTQVECNAPDYVDTVRRGMPVAMGKDVAGMMRALLKDQKPVSFGTEADARNPVPKMFVQTFGTRSLLAMALHPKTGNAWLFGAHQFCHARTWTAEDQRLFQEVGRRLADALSVLVSHRDLQDREHRLRDSNAQLRELTIRRETAREEERKRIAREIHDELGQNLTALRMGISRLRFQFSAEHPALAEHIEDMQKLAAETLQTVRHIAGSLRPAALEAGIVAAVSWLGLEFENHAKIACRVSLPDGPIELDEERSLALFRITQESLTNVARHSGASRVDIALKREDGHCAIDIRDDGCGFDSASKPGGSFGLIGMRERAEMAGGTIRIESAPACGTTVAVRIPIQERKEAS
jgi:PAS domain S-box-containing protein